LALRFRGLRGIEVSHGSDDSHLHIAARRLLEPETNQLWRSQWYSHALYGVLHIFSGKQLAEGEIAA
jgi:hypothetical protein